MLSIPFIKLPCSSSYKCQFCPHLQFVTAKNFSDHVLQIHNQKPFQCSDCSVAYMHKSNLEDHIRAKHVSGEPDIPCDKCGKMFRTKTSLFVHRREQVSLYHNAVSVRFSILVKQITVKVSQSYIRKLLIAQKWP